MKILRPQRSSQISSQESEDRSAPALPVHLENVHVSFDEAEVLRGVSLDVCQGEFLTILGPSGSGKTTTLNVIAGFVQPRAGEVCFGDTDVSSLPVHKRNIGFLFQSYALFPHLDVFRNVAYPLKERRVPKAEIPARVEQTLALVDLEGYGPRQVSTLSGGQQQRVGLARALVSNPSVLLLDEPLGALDKSLRERMQLELRKLQQRVGVTTISVTHDQTEALSMSDRVVIMRDGRVEQVGSPEELYWAPRTAFVAGFLGEANILPVFEEHGGGWSPDLCERVASGGAGSAVVRPETLAAERVDPTAGDASPRWVVTDTHFHGHRNRVVARSESSGRSVVVYRRFDEEPIALGDRIVISCVAPKLVSLIEDPAPSPGAAAAGVPDFGTPLEIPLTPGGQLK